MRKIMIEILYNIKNEILSYRYFLLALLGQFLFLFLPVYFPSLDRVKYDFFTLFYDGLLIIALIIIGYKKKLAKHILFVIGYINEYIRNQ